MHPQPSSLKRLMQPLRFRTRIVEACKATTGEKLASSTSSTTMSPPPTSSATATGIVDVLLDVKADEAPPEQEELADDTTAELETKQEELAAIEAKLAAVKEEVAKEETGLDGAVLV